MPDLDSDGAANKDDVVQDDPKQVTGTPPTLDQVHQMNQAKVEAEDAADADTNSGEEENEEASADAGATGGDDDAGTGEDDAGEAAGDDDDAGAEGAGDAGAQPTIDTPVVSDTSKSAPELNTDITKPGEGKIEAMSLDGTRYYFNNESEVPNDFEPVSYKETMRISKEFAKKELKDETAAEKKAADDAAAAETAETTKRIADMEAGWETEATDLTTIGLLPKDPTKNQAAKEEVYTYIDSELAKGNVISSFKQAYKSMMYDKEQAAKEAQQKKLNQDKKARGGVVQPGSGGGSPDTSKPRTTGGGRIIQAPPQGAGLDAVHANVVANL